MFICENKSMDMIARKIITPVAMRQPLFPPIFVDRMTKKGANKAPTAKMLCKKLNAAGLLFDTSFTKVLLKFEILPRLSPVNKKPKRSRTGFPVIIIMKNP